jgi:hypothetical protein
MLANALDAEPFASAHDGVPHVWCPDLDTNEHTLSALVAVLAQLAVNYGDAILDGCECDASGAYLAFRAPAA